MDLIDLALAGKIGRGAAPAVEPPVIEPPAYVYECTGDKDTFKLATIINVFFNSGAEMSKKIIITGTMGLSNVTTELNINAANARGAVCYLDFTDCDIPPGSSTSGYFMMLGNGARLDVEGLRISNFNYGVYLGTSGGRHRFSQCSVKARTSAVVTTPGCNQNIFTDCELIGVSESSSAAVAGLTLQSSNNVFSNCILSGSGISSVSGANVGHGVRLLSTDIKSNHFNGCIISGNNYGVEIAAIGNSVFVGCDITGLDGKPYSYSHAVFQPSGAAGSAAFVGCRFEGEQCAIRLTSVDPEAEVILIACNVKSTFDNGNFYYAIEHASNASKLTVLGCRFTAPAIKAGNVSNLYFKVDSRVYMPEFANRFNCTVQ